MLNSGPSCLAARWMSIDIHDTRTTMYYTIQNNEQLAGTQWGVACLSMKTEKVLGAPFSNSKLPSASSLRRLQFLTE